MTEAEVIDIMRKHLDGLFPKMCAKCKRRFETLREYVLNTKRLDPVMSFDAEMGDWTPTRPIGTAAYANCVCGNTLALSSDGMTLSQRHSLLNWVRIESQRQGLDPQKLLGCVRNKMREQIIAEPEEGGVGHLEDSPSTRH
jgi:hypothetical protein